MWILILAFNAQMWLSEDHHSLVKVCVYANTNYDTAAEAFKNRVEYIIKHDQQCPKELHDANSKVKLPKLQDIAALYRPLHRFDQPL